MKGAMAVGFVSGSGIEPSQLRTVMLSIALGFVFVFGAWVLTKVIEALNDDHTDCTKIFRSTISLGIIISFLTYLLLKN